MVNNVQSNIDIILDNTALERVKHTKFLGVLIDECLTWKQHIDCMSKTLARNIGVINKIKHFVPNRILHTFILYTCITLPYIWSACLGEYMQIIFRQAYKTSKMGHKSHF